MPPKKQSKSIVPAAASRPSSVLKIITLILLPLFSLAGLYGTLFLASSNGTVAVLQSLAEQRKPLLPGTSDLLVKKYTGNRVIDNQLIILVAFFAPVLDDQNSALKLFSIFGLGQFGASWAIMQLESLRKGNSWRVISFVGTFGFFIQNITFVVTAPWWAFIHLLTSPAAAPFPGSFSSNVLAVSKLDLAILPVSVILGYLVPSILMTLPSPAVLTALRHQQAIALWQPFPIWCVIFQTLLRYTFVGSKVAATKAPQASLGASYVSSAAHVYRFIIGLCMITHLPALALALLPASMFSNAHPLIQSLAKAEFVAAYIPYFPDLTYQVESFAAGVHAFLQWDMYIGATALLVWGIYLHQNAAREKSVVKLLGKVGFWTVLAGPSGALAVLMWERDQMAQGKIKQGI